MHPTIEQTCKALESLAESIQKGSTDDRTLREMYGWNCSPLSRHDLANIPRSLSERLRKANLESLPENRVTDLASVPSKVKQMQADTIPYFFNGNAAQAVPAFLSFMAWLNELMSPLMDWQQLADNKVLPAALIRKLRSIQADLETLLPDKMEIEKQISQIRDATEAAESLPTDLRSLREARATMNQLNLDSAKEFGLIGERRGEAVLQSEVIKSLADEAKQLVSNCEEAYRITTTKGLAAAFDARAKSLSNSLWAWVLGLVLALTLGSWIGSVRLETLTQAMAIEAPNWSLIWLNIILSILSVGAPLWFAWLATKQIGQRFRLAEDYAFKASVAKAYEGYKREAARLDEKLEHRLFSSALSRLEKAPLRLIEEATHGSPWHEIASSKPVQATLDVVSDLSKQTLEKVGLNQKSGTEQ